MVFYGRNVPAGVRGGLTPGADSGTSTNRIFGAVFDYGLVEFGWDHQPCHGGAGYGQGGAYKSHDAKGEDEGVGD